MVVQVADYRSGEAMLGVMKVLVSSRMLESSQSTTSALKSSLLTNSATTVAGSSCFAEGEEDEKSEAEIVGGCPDGVDRHSEFCEARKVSWIDHVAEEVQTSPVFQRVCAELVHDFSESAREGLGRRVQDPPAR